MDFGVRGTGMRTRGETPAIQRALKLDQATGRACMAYMAPKVYRVGDNGCDGEESELGRAVLAFGRVILAYVAAAATVACRMFGTEQTMRRGAGFAHGRHEIIRMDDMGAPGSSYRDV